MALEGMTCSNCSNAIEAGLKNVEGIINVSVSLMTHKAVVEYKSQVVNARDIIDEVEDLGFGASLITNDGNIEVRQLA